MQRAFLCIAISTEQDRETIFFVLSSGVCDNISPEGSHQRDHTRGITKKDHTRAITKKDHKRRRWGADFSDRSRV